MDDLYDLFDYSEYTDYVEPMSTRNTQRQQQQIQPTPVQSVFFFKKGKADHSQSGLCEFTFTLSLNIYLIVFQINTTGLI